MQLSIRHVTRYSYDQPVAYGLQELRLTPKSRTTQVVERWRTTVTGGQVAARFEDQHMNTVELVVFDAGVREIEIVCDGEVETRDNAGILGPHAGFAPLWLFERATDLTRAGNGVRKLIGGLTAEHDGELAQCHALMHRVAEAVRYDIGHTDAATSAEDAVAAGHGVCQDQTHVFLAGARALGIPARYVSGYLMMTDRVEQDAAHAWAEAHVPNLGWVGFDIANGVCPDERHVRVATGLDYREAAPVHGLRYADGGAPAREELAVEVQVQQ